MDTKMTYAQLIAAKLPFNPLGEGQIVGNNSTILKDQMKMLQWNDPRFVEKEDVLDCGWKLAPNSLGVQVSYRNPADGSVSKKVLYNAGNVIGMPTLNEMAGMSPEQVQGLRQSRSIEIDDEELEMMPVRQQEVGLIEETEAASVKAPATPLEHTGKEEYLVVQNYWQNGTHNEQGRKLAEELNATIKKSKLQFNEEAVKKLLANYRNGDLLGLSVMSKSELERQQIYQDDPARPIELLGGKFLRYDNGCYRSTLTGGIAVQDKGESLRIRDKSEEGFTAAMELAKAKGWTTIELKGKPKHLAAAWLEARMNGIEVIGYEPTAKDHEKYASRLAKVQAKQGFAERENLASEDQEVVAKPVKQQEQAKHCVTEGEFHGKILRVMGEFAEQKVGREESDTVWHDVTLLDEIPEPGKVLGIRYQGGKGQVRAPEREQGAALAR